MKIQCRDLFSIALRTAAALAVVTTSTADEYGAVAVIAKPGGSEVSNPMAFDFWAHGLGTYYISSRMYEEHHISDKLRLINDRLRVDFPSLFTSALLEVNSDFFNVQDLNSGPKFLSTEESKILTSQPGRYSWDQFGGFGIRRSGNEFQVHLDWLALSENLLTYGEGNVTFDGKGLNSIGGTMTLRTNIHEEPLTGNIKPIRGAAEITGGIKYSVSAGPRTYTMGLTVADDWGRKGTVVLTFDTESQVRSVSVIVDLTTWVEFTEQPGGTISPAWNLGLVPFTVRLDVPNDGPVMMNVGVALQGSGISVSGGNTAQGGEVVVTIDANTLIDWVAKSVGN